VFTGAAAPDYYGQDEESPSFPEGCMVNSLPGAKNYRDEWNKAKEQGQKSEKPDDFGAARDEPYYWTNSLTGEDFRGAGIFADVVLYFDSSEVTVSINGREYQKAPYTADKNDYENQIVYTDGLFCRDGWVKELRFAEGFQRDRQLVAELVGSDGSKQSIIFHTGSEEYLYLGDQ
jgi:hypothetical protein